MLLAIDTSTQTIGIAFYDEPVLIGELVWRTGSHHTVELAPAIAELMRRCKVKPGDLEALGVALGPGSFTTLRIGLALAKGMALSLAIPVIGVPTFEYQVAAQPLAPYPLLAVLPAGRSRMAVQQFKADDTAWQPDGEPAVLTPESISDMVVGPTLICGEMNTQERQAIGRKWKNAMIASPGLSMRRPGVLAELAWRRWKAGQVDDPALLSPIYLHIAGIIQE